MSLVLVVGDSGPDALPLPPLLGQSGLQSCMISSPEELGELAAGDYSLILVDRVPGDSDAGSTLSGLQQKLPPTPMIVLTGDSTAQIASQVTARQALQLGVAGCLPRRTVRSDLARALQTIRANGDSTSTADGFGISYTIENSPELLPMIVSQVRQRIEDWPFADPIETVRVTVALSEALDNALYHGNLELDSDLRQGDGQAWRDESLRRRGLAPFRDRRIRFDGWFGSDAARFTVRDEGTGFNPLAQVDCTETQNLERCSGRGLLLMQMYMDAVDFNDTGNEVTLIKRRPSPEFRKTL